MMGGKEREALELQCIHVKLCKPNLLPWFLILLMLTPLYRLGFHQQQFHSDSLSH